MKNLRSVIKYCVFFSLFFSLNGADLSSALSLLKTKLLSLAITLKPVEKKYNSYEDFIEDKIKNFNPDILFISRGCAFEFAEKRLENREEKYKYIKEQQFPQFLEKITNDEKYKDKKVALFLIDPGFNRGPEYKDYLDQGLPEGLWKDGKEKKLWNENISPFPPEIRCYLHKTENIYVFVIGHKSEDYHYVIARSVIDPCLKKGGLVVMGDYAGSFADPYFWGYYQVCVDSGIDVTKALEEKKIGFYMYGDNVHIEFNNEKSFIFKGGRESTKESNQEVIPYIINNEISNINPDFVLFVVEPSLDIHSFASRVNAFEDVKKMREKDGLYDRTLKWLEEQAGKKKDKKFVFIATISTFSGSDFIINFKMATSLDYFKDYFKNFNEKNSPKELSFKQYKSKENHLNTFTYYIGDFDSYIKKCIFSFKKFATKVLPKNCLFIVAMQNLSEDETNFGEWEKEYGPKDKFFVGTYDQVNVLFEKSKIKFFDKDGFKITK